MALLDRVREERGVALVEFALVAPVFVLMIAGLLAFGRVFFYWIDANHLASETARWAVVDRNPYPTSLQQQVKQSSTVEFTDAQVCIDFLDDAEIGDPLRVTVRKPFTFVPILDIGNITIEGSATMRVERFANGVSPGAYKVAVKPAGDDDLGCANG